MTTEPIKLITITSSWHNNDRTTLLTEDGHGIVEIEYPKDHAELGYIWNLWVDSNYRKQGYATTLLKAATDHIRTKGKTKAVLDWDKRDTPLEIYRWYERQGFRETEFGRYGARLEKPLAKP